MPNQFGFFSSGNTQKGGAAFTSLRRLLDDFVKAHFSKQLLKQFSNSDSRKTTSILLFRNKYPEYLEAFVRTFENDKDLESTLQLYKHLSPIYRKIHAIEQELNFNPEKHPSHTIATLTHSTAEALKPFNDTPFYQNWAKEFTTFALEPIPRNKPEKTEQEDLNLSKQQTAYYELQNELINNIKNELYPHPAYDKHYYQLKFAKLWNDYTEEYGKINADAFITEAIQAITQEMQDEATATIGEAIQLLKQDKPEYNPATSQIKQEKQNESALRIAATQPRLEKSAESIVQLAITNSAVLNAAKDQEPSSLMASKELHELAIKESESNRFIPKAAPSPSPALFKPQNKLTPKSRDTNKKKAQSRAIFERDLAKINRRLHAISSSRPALK